MHEQITLIYSYLHGMWRYRWSALVIAWIVALLGWTLVYTLPDKFSVRTVVYVDTSSILKPLLKGLAVETDTRDELRIMTRMLLSRENLFSVARESDMDLEANTPEEKDRLVKDLAKTIKINGTGGGRSYGGKNNVYEISYQSNVANRAYQVVSNLLNTMIEGTLNSTRTDTASAQKFLSSQIDIYEERLSLAEQKLADFKKENVGYMPNERGNFYTRLQGAEDSVEETASTLRLAERRYSELTRQLKGESPILGSDGYQSENAKKIKLYQEQLDLLLNQYTDKHPDVRALQVIIEELKTTPNTTNVSPNYTDDSDKKTEFNPVYQEVKVELSKAAVEVEILKAKLKEQKESVDKLRAAIDVIPEVEAKLTKLNRGYEVTRERYLDLVERRESAQLAQSADQSSSDIDFRVIEPPIVPHEPSGPKRMLYLGGVLLASFAVGLAWSFLRYMLQPTFTSLEQLGTATGRPVLGSVSLYLSPEHKKRRRLQLSSFVTATFMLLVVFGAVIILRDLGSALVVSVITGK